MSWKTVYFNEKTKVSLEQKKMKVKIDDEYITIPLGDIQTVIFAHDGVVITMPLISALIENNIGVITCNKVGDPNGIFLPFNSHSLAFKQIEQQVNWKHTTKKKLWKLIIEQKIKSEICTLKRVHIDVDTSILDNYMTNVKSNDTTNREGLAAKSYFKLMFGSEYFRNAYNTRNYALNYGYKVLASFISRYIASRGYITQLGIFHHGSSNPFNLTYDFIEIFRYTIDIWVLYNIDDGDRLNAKHKVQLVNILNAKMKYDGKLYRLNYIIENVVNDYFRFLLGEDIKIKFPIYDSIIYNTD